MLPSFFRGRENNYFKARSASRDAEVDRARAVSILRAIREALQEAKTEHAGLILRIDDATARAAVTLGNDFDEYLTREPEDNQYQNLLDTEIANGQRRLNELEMTITHFQFLETALITKFSSLRPGSSIGSD